MCSLTLTSLLIIFPSIPPVVSMWLFQASESTRDRWQPLNVLSCKIWKYNQKSKAQFGKQSFTYNYFRKSNRRKINMQSDALQTCRLAVESHIWTWELFKPIAICRPSGAQLTLVTRPSSSSMVTSSEVEPFEASQRYTVLLRAMASTLLLPQSSKFK